MREYFCSASMQLKEYIRFIEFRKLEILGSVRVYSVLLNFSSHEYWHILSHF